MEMMERANWLSGYKAWESPNGLYRIEVENIDWSNRKVYFSFGRAFAFSGKLIVEKRFSAEGIHFGASVSNNGCMMACGMSGPFTHYVWYMGRSLEPEPITVMDAVPIYGVYITPSGSYRAYITDAFPAESLRQRIHFQKLNPLGKWKSFSLRNIFNGVFPPILDIDDEVVSFLYGSDASIVKVSHAGKVLNPDVFYDLRKTDAYKAQTGHSLYYLAAESSSDKEAEGMLFDALKKHCDAWLKARINRKIAEIYDLVRGDQMSALPYYEEALFWDAGVGVKRRLASIRKRIIKHSEGN